MFSHFKNTKQARRIARRSLLGFISCNLCLLLSEPSLIVLGQTTTHRAHSDLLENKEAQKLAQIAIPKSDSTPPDKQVLIEEVKVQGASGKLAEIVYQTVNTKPGRTTTRSQLQKDINAIFKTGWFSSVRAEPADIPKGIQVTFIVEPNPVLRQVKILTTSNRKSDSLFTSLANDIFQSQYGKVINLQTLQTSIKKLNQRHQKNSYASSRVVGVPEISRDGILTLQVSESKDKADADLPQAGAQKNQMTEANALRTLANKQSIDKNKKKQAISNLKNALKIYQRLNNDKQSAIVLHSIGYLFQELEDYPAATIAYRQAAPLFKKINQPFWQALTLSNLAETYRKVDDIDRSLSTYQQALPIWTFLRKHPNQLQSSLFASAKKYKDGQIYMGLSFSNSAKTGFQSNINFYIGTYELPKSGLAEVYIGESLTLFNIASIYQSVGDYQQALYTYKTAWPLLEISRRTIQTLVRNSSIASKEKGELIAETVELFESLLMSMSYTDMGLQQQAQKSRDRVLVKGRIILEKFLQQTMATKKSPELQALLPVIGSQFMGLISSDSSTLSEAQKSQRLIDWGNQILQFVQPLIAKQPQFQKQAQLFLPWLEISQNYFLGETLAKADKHQQAIDAYRKVLAQWEKTSPINLKTLRSLFPNNSLFAEEKNQSSIAESLDSVEYMSHAAVYNAMGKSLLALGEKEESIKAHQQAMQILQTGRNLATKNYPARPQSANSLNQILQTWLPKFSDELTANTFYRLGKAYAANRQSTLALESYRNALPLWREAKKILQEADTNWEIASVQRQQGDLAQAKTQIEAAINQIESDDAQISHQQKKQGSAKNSPPQKSTPYKSYINLADYLASKQNYYGFYIDLLMQLHQKFPTSGYEELAFQASERSHARSLRSMLNRATRPNSTNPPGKIQAIQISQVSSLKEIQQQLLDEKTILLEYALGAEHSYLWAVTNKGLKVYTLPKRAEIETVSRKFLNLMSMPSYQIGDRNSAIQQGANNSVQVDAAEQLSQMLLGPVAGQLGNKRLLVVSDGILHYLPFAALPKPGTIRKNQIPLLIDHEIEGLPSASMQIGLQQRRAKAKAPTKTLAMLADPVFSLDDRRLHQRATNRIADVETMYKRLPGTRREANQIVALVSPSKSLIKLNTDASHRFATGPELAKYRMVHFASHGILNSQNPQQSGMVLSIVDNKGELQRGLLSAADAFNLKLSADLVVLSGCKTALGKQIQGEGMIGLTGGLMYAGAKQVVAGLWNVSDDSTSVLMTQFYQGMLSKGLSPVAALRAAQLKLWNNKDWKAPYYWAAFTLQGS